MEKRSTSDYSSRSPRQEPHTRDDQERRWCYQQWWLLGLLHSWDWDWRTSAHSQTLLYLLGLLLGEMVTSLRMTLGDCCRGGVRQGLSSTSGREVRSSPTSTRSRLPSSIPFPSHRPQGNLEVKQWPIRVAHFSRILPRCSAVPSTKPIHRGTLQNQTKGSPDSLSHSVSSLELPESVG